MEAEKTGVLDRQIYFRLIAMWVVCEALIGGMIHGLKLPVSGLIVGSCAVVCICLIAWYVPTRGAILKASVIVAVFKMLLSPHTPLPAYFAVLFQGFMGHVLFSRMRFFRLSCVLLGVIALVESAIQRILVMVVLYGTDFWKAVDSFVSRLTGAASVTSYSLNLAAGYVILHAVVGCAVGWFASHIIRKAEKNSDINARYIIIEKNVAKKPVTVRKKKLQYFLLFAWLLLGLLLLQSYFEIGDPILPENKALGILLRSILILLTWHLFLNPLLTAWMKSWLASRQMKQQTDIRQVALFLPATEYIFRKSWELSSSQKGIRRIAECCKIILVNILRKNA